MFFKTITTQSKFTTHNVVIIEGIKYTIRWPSPLCQN